MSEVLSWARRWARRPTATEHELLELARSATLDDVRAAYHKLARFAHPDLHRTAMTPAQLEDVTAAFARVSNAYAVLSGKLRREAKRAPANPGEPAPSGGHAPARPSTATMAPKQPPARPSSTAPGPTSSSTGAASASAGPSAAGAAGALAGPVRAASTTSSPSRTGATAPLPIGPANAMSPRALGHYRRAELAMLRGNSTEALLHLRMAIASDPQSSFLRAALAELEAR
ncbi:MAG: DnaJ domain-containing protein [Myxococcales bacterium]|nr:DnaJ domain-containing protein [Myxococcales bacterium]